MTPRSGPTQERLRKAARISELRASGLSYKEIAIAATEEFGTPVSMSTVGNLLIDPDGRKARARKDSYGGRCVDCGGPTTGSNGRAKAPTRCRRCAQGHLDSPSERRTQPVTLVSLPLDLRLAGAREANRVEQGEYERMEILLAALYPSSNVYYVADGAQPRIAA